MTIEDNRKTLRVDEVANKLGVSTRTLARWRAASEGPPWIQVGRTVLYSVRSLDQWIHQAESV